MSFRRSAPTYCRSASWRIICLKAPCMLGRFVNRRLWLSLGHSASSPARSSSTSSLAAPSSRLVKFAQFDRPPTSTSRRALTTQSMASGWQTARLPSGTEYRVYDTARIEVSPNDPRQYRYVLDRSNAALATLLTVRSTRSLIKLRNNLQALLISDPATDKAAAALGVQVGHLSDPDDLPGLAHFCEHSMCARLVAGQVPEENR